MGLGRKPICGVLGSGFRVQGLGFRGSGSGSGLGFGVGLNAAFRVACRQGYLGIINRPRVVTKRAACVVLSAACRLRPPREPRTVSVRFSSVKGTLLAALAGIRSAF